MVYKFPLVPVSIDTRTLKEGELFCALEGIHSDGHDFVKEALQKKALGCIVREDFEPNLPNLFRVPDPLMALHQLAEEVRKTSSAQIIAITGSSGKTTTKEMLSSCLGDKTCLSQGNFNNHIGVPLSLTHLNPAHEYGVFEAGMNHRGEIAPLSKLIQPHIAVITSIGEAHIGNLGSIEETRQEKMDIAVGLKEWLIAPYNLDIQYKKLFTVGVHQKADLFFDGHKSISVDGKKFPFYPSYREKHSISNALLALAVSYLLGCDLPKAIRCLENFSPLRGRGKQSFVNLPQGGEVCLIDDSYNANPESMRESLSSFKKCKYQGRKVAILGEMLELGDESERYHREIIPYLKNLDVVILSGGLMKCVFEELPVFCRKLWCKDASELKQSLSSITSILKNKDTVFVKGSKGSQVSLVVQKLLQEL